MMVWASLACLFVCTLWSEMNHFCKPEKTIRLLITCNWINSNTITLHCSWMLLVLKSHRYTCSHPLLSVQRSSNTNIHVHDPVYYCDIFDEEYLATFPLKRNLSYSVTIWFVLWVRPEICLHAFLSPGLAGKLLCSHHLDQYDIAGQNRNHVTSHIPFLRSSSETSLLSQPKSATYCGSDSQSHSHFVIEYIVCMLLLYAGSRVMRFQPIIFFSFWPCHICSLDFAIMILHSSIPTLVDYRRVFDKHNFDILWTYISIQKFISAKDWEINHKLYKQTS